MNKIGDNKTIVLDIILGAVIVVLALLIINNADKWFGNNINSKLSCQGAFGIGFGYCESSCEPPAQEIAEPIGKEVCKKQSKICCLSLEKKDATSVTNTGGDATHDFTVYTIGAQNMAELTGTYHCSGSDTNLICPPNHNIRIIIKVSVKNEQLPMSIYE